MPVTKLEIKSRVPFAGGQAFGGVGSYEQIDGVVHFAVDPQSAANETIADIGLAPRDAQGKVAFSSDFRIFSTISSPWSRGHQQATDPEERFTSNQDTPEESRGSPVVGVSEWGVVGFANIDGARWASSARPASGTIRGLSLHQRVLR